MPLSGGLDTRTLAAALFGNKNIVTFSYEFEGGINETGYARQIAEASDGSLMNIKYLMVTYGEN